jgi:hypothetical protein
MATIPPIDQWAQSRYGFYVDRQWRGGRWVLEPGPVVLASYHARILRHCFTPDGDGRLPYDVIAWCEPAKSGKSAIAGLCAEYMALHGEQNSVIVMASNKQDQAASVMFKSLTDSIGLNPHLPGVSAQRYEATFRNGNTARAIPSNSRGEAGARFSLALFDELWAYVYEDAERLWAEHKTDPTRLNSVKMAVGYAGYDDSKLWLELLQSGLAGEPVSELADVANEDGDPACWRNGRTFVFWSHVCRQPWQTEAWRESQRRALRPSEYARMIETRFVEGVGNFVEPSAWEACVDPNHKPLEPGDKRFPVYVGLDLALSAGGDDCAVIGVYPEGGKVKAAFHKVWKGRDRKADLKLSQSVEPFLLWVKDSYHLAGVYFDPWQARHLVDSLQAAGLPCFEVPQTHATRGPLDTALYEMAVNRELVLYDSQDLKDAARHANAKELGNGQIFLTKAGRGKIDLLVALSNCAGQARDQGGMSPVIAVSYGEWLAEQERQEEKPRGNLVLERDDSGGLWVKEVQEPFVTLRCVAPMPCPYAISIAGRPVFVTPLQEFSVTEGEARGLVRKYGGECFEIAGLREAVEGVAALSL